MLSRGDPWRSVNVARFSEQFIQQVTQATDIVELIGQYVALTKKGREFAGLCPFHDDHKPSMSVSPAKQIYKCFACGAGGGAAKFLMDYEKLAFPQAVRQLAERANIPIPREYEQTDTAGQADKRTLERVMAFAQSFFRSQLTSPAGRTALDYARSRGLTDESIERFGLGLAVDAWDALATAARRKGVRERDLLATGLVIRRDGREGCYDRFRNRLMFPIHDLTGKVAAFGGRALGDDPAKYMNSPETPLFDKSGLLYAMNWSRDAIRNSGRAIVVEGYLDVLIPLQAGVDNIVATMGTSLTERHVRLLARFANEAVLVFDADIAGAAAAERAVELFIAQQLNVRVATIPAGKDPADLVTAGGPDALRQIVDDAPDAIQYVLAKRLGEYQQAGGNLADRRQIIEQFLQMIVSSAAYGAIDELRRGELAQHVAHLLNVPASDLQQQMRRLARRVRPQASSPAPRPADAAANAPLAERHVIEVLLNEPELFDQAAERIDAEDISDPQLRPVAECIWRMGRAGHLHVDELLAMEEMVNFGPMLTDLATAGEHRGNYEATLTDAVDDILRRRQQAEADRLRSAADDDEALRKLAQHYRQSDQRRRPKIS